MEDKSGGERMRVESFCGPCRIVYAGLTVFWKWKISASLDVGKVVSSQREVMLELVLMTATRNAVRTGQYIVIWELAYLSRYSLLALSIWSPVGTARGVRFSIMWGDVPAEP